MAAPAPAPVKWFIQVRGVVQGPFNNENLEQALQGLGDSYQTALVWKRGLSEWVQASQWKKADQQIAAAAARNKQSPSSSATPSAKATSAKPPPAVAKPPPSQQTQVTVLAQNTPDDRNASTDDDLFEKTFTQAFSDNVFYRVQVNFVDQPLMSKNELLQLIAKTDDLSTISIQDAKTKEWKEIYAYPDLVEKFGISRRKSQRVPILAQFNGKSSKSKNVSYRVITISEGGMGFTENYDLKIGDEVEGQISSPHFFQPINVKADVIYAGLDGYIGLKFSTVTAETKAAIIEYIKKFGKSSPK
ncbi:MAG: hypothetical protein K0R29_1433 [Pseudobdellovibrio sp.]|jgi:hypothetical protein|nr:hypothetical protein [Pseudobdellovibrio sp.]